MIEYKRIPFEMSFFNTEEGTFSGHASVFNVVDLVGDYIKKGSFKKTLQERGDKIFIAWQHNWTMPIGKPLELGEDKEGLLVKAKISQTTMGKDAIILLKDGVIKELSIGYEVLQAEWAMVDQDGNLIEGEEKAGKSGRPVRVLKEIRLYEISIVSVAANPMALITDVKQCFGCNLPTCSKHGDCQNKRDNPYLPKEYLWSLAQLERKGEMDKNDKLYIIDEQKAAIPYSKTPLAPEGEAWDAAAEMAKESTPEGWRAMCAMIVGDPEVKGSYKLPHHKGGGDHACVWNGVRAAMAALGGARTPVQGEGQSGARAHISKHYADFDKPLPGEGDGEGDSETEERSVDQSECIEPSVEILKAKRERLIARNKVVGLRLPKENGDEAD